MAERDFSEIARLSERYNKDPKSRIFVQLADAYRKSGMIDEALEILQKGLEHHPNYPLAHLILGKCYYDKRMFEQAKSSFEKTLNLDPQNIVALRMLAQTCATTKDEQGQIDAYKGLLAIDPYDAQAKEKLDELQAKQRKEPLHTIAMVEEYEKQGNLDKALEVCEHMLYTDPTDIGLQQKVQSLKVKIDANKKKEDEMGIEELQVEEMFHPDQLTPSTTPSEQTPQAPAEGEEVMQLDDFLSPEETPAPDSSEKLDILQPFGETPKPPEENLDILQPTEASEITQTPETPMLQPEDLTPIPADSQASEAPPLKPEEPATPPAEPQPTEAPADTQKGTTAPLSTDEKKETPTPDQGAQTETPQPKPESKPKEEDFKSFQDWLSGLLK